MFQPCGKLLGSLPDGEVAFQLRRLLRIGKIFKVDIVAVAALINSIHEYNRAIKYNGKAERRTGQIYLAAQKIA